MGEGERKERNEKESSPFNVNDYAVAAGSPK